MNLTVIWVLPLKHTTHSVVHIPSRNSWKLDHEPQISTTDLHDSSQDYTRNLEIFFKIMIHLKVISRYLRVSERKFDDFVDILKGQFFLLYLTLLYLNFVVRVVVHLAKSQYFLLSPNSYSELYPLPIT